MARGGSHGGGFRAARRIVDRTFDRRLAGPWYPYPVVDVIDEDAIVDADPDEVLAAAADDDGDDQDDTAIAQGETSLLYALAEGIGGAVRDCRDLKRRGVDLTRIGDALDAAARDGNVSARLLRESIERGVDSMTQGGAFDKLANLVAEHERFWGELGQRNPEHDTVRWFLSSDWDPFYTRWVQLVGEHGLGDDDLDVLAQELHALNDLRLTAAHYGIPVPPVDAATLSDGAIAGLEIGYPHVVRDPSSQEIATEVSEIASADTPEQQIDAATDQRFWQETGYKPGQRLDRHNARDRHMINTWLRIRYEVAQEFAQQNAAHVGAIPRDPRGPTMSKNSLIHCGAVLAPMHTRAVKVNMSIGGDGRLNGSICIDGKCYEGSVDLTPLFTEIHRNLHMQGGMPMPADNMFRATPMMGRSHGGGQQRRHRGGSQDATPADDGNAVVGDYHQIVGIEAVGHAERQTTLAAGQLLVGKLLDQARREKVAGWWSDLKKKVKGVAHSVEHEVTHPNELMKDVSHYALHPSQLVVKAAEGLGAGAGLAKAISYAADPLQDITENPAVQQMVATSFGGPAGAAAFQAATSLDSGKGIAGTLQAMAPQIASAASQAAGAAAGPQAAALTTALVNAAAGTGSASQVAQQAVNAAKQVAQSDPQVAAALDAAHDAVAKTTAVYHIAQTASNAAQGDANAQAQVAQLAESAAAGDPAAQAAAQVAQQVTDLASSNAVTQGAADPRAVAAAAAAGSQGRVVGVVIPNAGNPMQVHTFATSDDADDWYGQWISGAPKAIEYIAYYDKGDATYPGPLNEMMSANAQETSARVSGFLPWMLGIGALGYLGVHEFDKIRARNLALGAAQRMKDAATLSDPTAAKYAAADAASRMQQAAILDPSLAHATAKGWR